MLFRPRHGVQDIELVVLEDFDPKLMHSESTNPISEAGYPDRILDSEFRETDVEVGKGEDQVFFILSRLLRKIPGKLNEADGLAFDTQERVQDLEGGAAKFDRLSGLGDFLRS